MNSTNRKERDSNLELLRCILMLMLLILHFNGLALPLPSQEELTNATSPLPVIQLAIECFTIIVVNCFVLLSGFYGIKPTLPKLFSLFIQCLFYGLIAFFVLNDFSFSGLLYSILVFSNSKLWFIPAYVGLFCFSPLLNKALENMNRKEYISIILIFTFLNVYLGWLWKGEINTTGYCTMQFIYLYIIGRFLKKYVNLSRTKANRNALLGGYVVFCIITTLFAYLAIMYWGDKHLGLHGISYNNPFIIIASICFLLFFSLLNIKSEIINWVAASSFTIYIIHSFFWSIISPQVVKQANDLSPFYFTLWCMAAITIIYVSSVL